MFSIDRGSGGPVASDPRFDVARLKGLAEHLSHVAALATLAANGPEPVRAARYIVELAADIAPDLRWLRASLRAPRSP